MLSLIHISVIFLYTEVLDMRKNLTEIVFILDRSGSMSGLEAVSYTHLRAASGIKNWQRGLMD